jgi:chromate reductase
MKNVVDWLSRPEDAGLLDGKPVAIMGATTGPWGTRYAQKELRHVLTATGAIVMPQPMLFVPNGDNAFDALGRLSDPTVERRLLQLLTAFDRWIELVTPANHTLSLSA